MKFGSTSPIMEFCRTRLPTTPVLLYAKSLIELSESPDGQVLIDKTSTVYIQMLYLICRWKEVQEKAPVRKSFMVRTFCISITSLLVAECTPGSQTCHNGVQYGGIWSILSHRGSDRNRTLYSTNRSRIQPSPRLSQTSTILTGDSSARSLIKLTVVNPHLAAAD